jgi:hypothetical protein
MKWFCMVVYLVNKALISYVYWNVSCIMPGSRVSLQYCWAFRHWGLLDPEIIVSSDRMATRLEFLSVSKHECRQVLFQPIIDQQSTWRWLWVFWASVSHKCICMLSLEASNSVHHSIAVALARLRQMTWCNIWGNPQQIKGLATYMCRGPDNIKLSLSKQCCNIDISTQVCKPCRASIVVSPPTYIHFVISIVSNDSRGYFSAEQPVPH